MGTSAWTSADSHLDQLIKLHKSIVETSAEASGALARATDEANTALTQLQYEFATAKRAFQDQLLRDVESLTDHTQSFLERLISGTDTAIQGVLGKIFSTIKEVESETVSLAQVCARQGYDI